MRNTFICLVIISLLSAGLKGQNRSGLFGHKLPGTRYVMLSAIGPAYCFGDLGVLDTKQVLLSFFDYRMFDTRILFSLGLRHVFPNNMGVKATAFYGVFGGTDKGSKYPDRGYSFETTVYELSIQSEYVLLGGPNSKRTTPHTLYGFIGGGFMYSKAYLTYKNISIKKTEDARLGDIVKPTNLAPVVPFGLGYQYQLSKIFSLGTELGWHYLFSDYVDGINTPQSNFFDILASLTFTFSYKISSSFPNEDKCHCLWH